jgi:hypothetical protein
MEVTKFGSVMTTESGGASPFASVMAIHSYEPVAFGVKPSPTRSTEVWPALKYVRPLSGVMDVYLNTVPPFSSSMKCMFLAASNWMPSCDVRGMMLRCT